MTTTASTSTPILLTFDTGESIVRSVNGLPAVNADIGREGTL
jgi:hypothetical protein